MTTFTIYLCLILATAAYAWLLAKYRHLWEPDFTWLEVVIGTALVLTAPYLDQRMNGPLTSELYEQRVWLAFALGGAPIVVWQLGKSIKARLQVEQRIRGSRDSATENTATVADQRRGQQKKDD